MKKTAKKVLSLVLALSMVFTIAFGVSASQEITVPTRDTSNVVVTETTTAVNRIFYELFNKIIYALVSGIMAIYPDPADWKWAKDYTAEGFMDGRDNYQTEAGENNKWSLGYASASLVPDDLTEQKYYIGRDLTERIAQGVYDDMRIRSVAMDDNSGNGIVIYAAVDTLGVTNADTISIRKGVLAWAEENGIDVANINITATHSHSALDTQGVATGSIYKILANSFANLLHINELVGMESATAFKKMFIDRSIKAVIASIENMTEGTMNYDKIDASYHIHDKRDLVKAEDIPEIVSILFTPDDSSINETYFINITCHPTSFSASNGLVSSDYIYWLDKYINENSPVANGDGANSIVVQGALGQVSRDNLEYDTTGMTEHEEMGAESKALGDAFAKLILAADYDNELAPILNTLANEFLISPTNTILALACKARLVNNQIYRTGIGPMSAAVATEIGYVEFGHEIAFATFPVELYPEVFWGADITGNATWDGTAWEYPAMPEMIDGIELHCISLCNDALGYVVTDNYFAYMGHIIGEEIADEILSLGGTAGSTMIKEFAVIANQVNAYNAE
ncbi:MAG: hypothetical protein E7523_08555 [Ruminococcaceae bacterium]|nr:hypothetical protein [Oscillospiraceae bacterium]